MSHLRLVDALRARPHWEDDARSRRELLDNLAHRVFTPVLDDEDAILKLYVQSGAGRREGVQTAQVGEEPETGGLGEAGVRRVVGAVGGPTALGPFERSLLGKLASGDKHLICVTGDIGCGKTLALRYLLGDPISNAPHPADHRGCRKKRLLVRLDFLNDTKLSSIVEDQLHRNALEEHLIGEVVVRIEHSIYACTSMTEQEELTGFWNDQFAEAGVHYFDTSVFGRLYNALKRRLPDGTDCATASIADRKTVRDAILEASPLPSEKLEYYARFLRYVKRVKYSNNSACQVFVIDNIDGYDPIVQSKVLSVLVSTADMSRSSFVLLLRPETLARRHKNTRVMDVVPHGGASTVEIVTDRLRRFVGDPWSYFHVDEEISRDEFEKIVSFCRRALVFLGEQTAHPVTALLRDVSGGDVRNGLMLAQELVLLSPSVRDDETASAERIARELIRGSGPFYSQRTQPLVENLFTTEEAEGRGRPLMKARMLHFLIQQSDHQASLDALVQELRRFGYRDTEICTGLNDLLSEARQLLRTNARDRYTPEAIANDGQDIVRLTSMGRGYESALYTMPTYVQEAMYEAVIDPELFGAPLLAEKLDDRLHLLGGFLDYLLDSDSQEVSEYLRRADIVQYTETFPRELITRRVIDACCLAVTRITDSVEAARAEDQSCTADGLSALRARMAAVRTRFLNLRDKATQLALD